MAGTLAVGFFDGVHLGHQSILSGADIAVTFKNHPLTFLAPERAPRLIMSWESRARAILALGVCVTALDFNDDLANQTPERFLDFLKEFASVNGWTRSAPLSVRCGANWRFGRGGVGDASWLSARGVAVTVVPAVEYAGEPISSTRIRAALESGRIADANAMLGRPFFVHGVPFVGKGEGRSLGYPTVNLSLQDLALKLPLGVYSVEVDGARGLANFGVAPTFRERAWKEPVMEIHFLKGLSPEVRAAETMRVEILNFIRPERTFATLDELKSQISKDIRDASEGQR